METVIVIIIVIAFNAVPILECVRSLRIFKHRASAPLPTEVRGPLLASASDRAITSIQTMVIWWIFSVIVVVALSVLWK